MAEPARPPEPVGRPSRWWLAAALAATVATVVATSAAIGYQRQATRPVGEGEVFVEDATGVSDEVRALFSDSMALSDITRHIRNELTIEGVGVIDSSGVFIAATSENLVGTPLDNELLLANAANQRFSAIASPIGTELAIDGVVEWQTGDVLYQIVHPLDDGLGSLVLYYDVSELLGRRAAAGGLQPETLQILSGAAFFALAAVALVVGRGRSSRRYRQLASDAEVIRRHADELETVNRGLIAARQEAERALDLAEETNRIRGEFVLMINHELRTPLTSIVTGAELLRNDELTGRDRDRLLDDMVSDGHRLHNMIAGILSVARIENRGLDYQLRAVTVDAAIDALQDAHPKVAVEIAHSETAIRRDVIYTDPQTLGQLVASITDNAFTHGAGSVRVLCSRQRPFEPMHQLGSLPTTPIFITVADDGPGIDPEFLPRAFEKFEKASFSSGTGLGLYMASLMAEALECALLVTTSPDGTSMSVAVPSEVS